MLLAVEAAQDCMDRTIRSADVDSLVSGLIVVGRPCHTCCCSSPKVLGGFVLNLFRHLNEKVRG